MYITEMKSNLALRNEAPTFLAQATENATPLGLTSGEIELLSDNVAAFGASMDAVAAAKAALRSAVEANNATALTLRRQIAQYAKTWRADLSIPDDLLGKMNVPPHETGGTTTPATTPTELSYSLLSDNTISLRWKRNGNKSGTVYNIQTSATGTSGWTIAKSTTKSKATLTSTPGAQLFIRVVAVRGDSTSIPSNPVVLWMGSGEGAVATLRVA